MNQNMRVLGRTRISRSTEESTSLERQRELIENWCDVHGHTLIGWAEDEGISGSIDPFDTPALGDWLNNRSHEFEAVCAWKLDRLARRSIPMHKLFGWCQEHEKTLVCISDNIDLSHWVGRLVASVIAGVAEGELEAIKERTKASHQKLKTSGRWTGGQVPFGYQPAPLAGGGKTLVQDPAAVATIRRIVDACLNGETASQIGRDLNADDVPTPKATNAYRNGRKTAWQAQSVIKILEHRSLIGQSTYKGEPVRDDNGEPVTFTEEPILTADEYRQVQDALSARRLEHVHRRTPTALYGVAYCWDCPDTRLRGISTRGRFYYYRCPECGSRMRQDELDPKAYDLFLMALGSYEKQERRVVRAVDHSARIAVLEQSITDVEHDMESFTAPAGLAVLTRQLNKMATELEELKAEQGETDRVEYVGTGQTWGQEFSAADTDERRDIMTRAGIKILGKRMHAEIVVPEDLKERLGIA